MKEKILEIRKKLKKIKALIFYRIGRLVGYYFYIKKRGLRNYWRYLRIITLMKVLGFRTLPEFDELIKTLDVFTYVMSNMGITVKEFGELLKKYSKNKGEIYKQELEKKCTYLKDLKKGLKKKINSKD